MNGRLTMSGNLEAVLMRGDRPVQSRRAPLAWRLRNALHWPYLKGWLGSRAAIAFSRLTGVATAYASLRAVLIHRNGDREDFGIVGFRLVTTDGVAYLVDAFQNTVEIENMKWHGAGTGVAGEDTTDVGLGTEITTGLNPDNLRVNDSVGEGATANIFRTIGTLLFDNTFAVTEHGIFSQAATGGGTLWDRTTFAAINVVSGDSIKFTYDLTVNSGG